MSQPRGRIDRRTFLRGAGGAAIALPFLNAMSCARGSSAPGKSSRGVSSLPKRFVVFFSANGSVPDLWLPSGLGADFQLGEILAPLEGHKNELIVLSGVDMLSTDNGPGDAHQKGMGHMLTGTELLEGGEFTGGNGEGSGWGGGISVDQEIARNMGGSTRFSSLELGVQVREASVWSRMCYLGPNQPIPPESSPYAVYERVFGDLDADPGGLKKRREQRRTVLGAVTQDYAALKGRLGKEDREKVDQHLTSIREIETRLFAGAEIGGACAKPSVGTPIDLDDSKNYPTLGRLQMDLLVMALACDLTRVASLQWHKSVSNKVMSWLDVSDGHHDLSHEGDGSQEARQKLMKINRWYAGELAYLCSALKAIPEGDGTLLDNTVILWCNELGKGNSHTRRDMPFVLAGRAGGALKTGRHLHFEGKVSHNNLLVSLLNAMDIPATTFGNPAYCTGPLAGLV